MEEGERKMKGVSRYKGRLWETSSRSIHTQRKKPCKHRWRIGSWNAYIIQGKLRKRSLNIWCEKCKKKIVAYVK
jgi:hypothetical protein